MRAPLSSKGPAFAVSHLNLLLGVVVLLSLLGASLWAVRVQPHSRLKRVLTFG
jgi:hypothetical protein